jgi:replicative DNA helicase
MINDYIKEQLPRYAEEHLQKIRSFKGMYICPLCGSGTKKNRTPAFSVKGRRWTCFSCAQGGDIVDLIQLTTGCTPQEAFQKAEEYAGIMKELQFASRDAGKPAEAKKEEDIMENIIIDTAEFIKRCQEYLPQSTRTIEYAEKRGITLADMQSWGWGANPDRGDALVIVKDDGCYEERVITDDAIIKHYKPKGVSDSLLWADALYDGEGKEVFVVEGPMDAAAIRKAGYPVLALCSTNNTPKLVELLKSKPTKNSLILALDSDEAGRKTAEKALSQLVELGVKAVSLDLWGKYKDANEYYVQDPEEFTNVLFRACFDTIGHFEQEKEVYLEKYSAKSLIKRMLENIAGGKYIPISTGYQNFDEAMEGGIRPVFYVVGAAPSLGKTTWTLQLADQLSKSGTDIMFFSLEMSEDEVGSKSISRISYELSNDIDISLTSQEVLNSEAHIFFGPAKKKLLEDSLYTYEKENGLHSFIFEGEGCMTVKVIREKVEEHIRIMGTRPVVIVDYLQMISSDSDHLTDKQIVDQAVLALKRMSRDLHIPVLTVSSFNRDGYAKASMSSFKESGSIEYSADVLLSLLPVWNEVDENNKPLPFEIEKFKEQNSIIWPIEMKILKNRSGRTGMSLHFDFLPKINKFIPR